VIVGTLCKICGFSHTEVRGLTLGQLVRYMRAVPELLPLSNAFAKAPEKPLTGEAAVVAMKALGM
jgi:hypothetical protein